MSAPNLRRRINARTNNNNKMTKNKIPPGPYLFPTPVVLIGANVNGKPNFTAIGWVRGLEFGPPLISISSNQQHHNNIGIKENQMVK